VCLETLKVAASSDVILGPLGGGHDGGIGQPAGGQQHGCPADGSLQHGRHVLVLSCVGLGSVGMPSLISAIRTISARLGGGSTAEPASFPSLL
jgi:hypothetical protein